MTFVLIAVLPRTELGGTGVLRYYGPFDSGEAAVEWGQAKMFTEEGFQWWVDELVDVNKPASA